MITQFLEELPEGKTTPDFTRKPIALTIQEGKHAFFKAIVVGDPQPIVTWERASGELLFHPNVCFQSTNSLAVCTAVLNVIEVGFSMTKQLQKAKMEGGVLKDSLKKNFDKPMEAEEKVWEILLSADKKDYERICCDFGITDFRGMLKKLTEMKKEREEEIAQFISHIGTLKPVEVKDDDCATIELDMDLVDSGSKIYLYKDGVMVPVTREESDGMKHNLKQVGNKYIFTIKNLGKDDAGLYSVDVGGVNVFSTEFKVPEVDFAVKIQEVKAEEREDALFQCVLTSPMNEIKWYGKSALLSNSEKHEITASEDKLIHKLIVRDCLPLDAGIYAAVAGIKSCNAWLIVEDPAKKSKKSARKTTMAGAELTEKMEIAKKTQAAREALEAAAQAEEEAAKKARAEAKAAAKAAAKAKRAAAGKDGAVRKSKKKGADAGTASGSGNEAQAGAVGVGAGKNAAPGVGAAGSAGGAHGSGVAGSTDAAGTPGGTGGPGIAGVTALYVYFFPLVSDPPRFDAEELEKFKATVTVKKGHKATFKIAYVGREPIKVQWYLEGEELSDESNIKIEHSEGSSQLLLLKLQRKDSGEVKIKLKNEFGSVEACTELNVLDKPTPPMGPLEIVEASSSGIEFKWKPPKDSGGCKIQNYILERQQIGRNTWKKVGPIGPVALYKDTDVDHGRRYCYRIRVETEIAITYPGPPSAPKVASAFKDCINLTWSPPADTGGTNILGYNLEKRKKGSNLWGPVNPHNEIIQAKGYAVKDVVEGIEYEFRVAAINNSGAGEFSTPSEFIFARDPKMRPRFTDAKVKSFMVVRAGNSARFNINFEASPWPEVIWLKDGAPVSKKVTVSNAEGNSQLLIASAERSDTGIYTIIVKNIVGQETFSVEIRVTDEPKPPGPVELDENVPGTVTVSWTASPDEKRDDRLHYMVTKRDSVKRSWHTIADRIFNNKFTACNILPGREYQFRVYAKNDMGSSKHSESAKWLIPFTVNMPESKPCDLQCAPKFIVPLKQHTAPQGYECYMSCAVKGDPTPHVTWLRNSISLNTDTNYFVSNTCGVCSLLILKVGSKDTGEYKVVAENPLGRAECSTKLTVRGKSELGSGL
uniref:Immunoglobulin like and fibronectin type III domain containing 1, tandem duplicate 1 n=1 Tax=Oryzias sinensis TaxID=183150 RepID=A0A8C7YJX4_9TELE